MSVNSLSNVRTAVAKEKGRILWCRSHFPFFFWLFAFMRLIPSIRLILITQASSVPGVTSPHQVVYTLSLDRESLCQCLQWPLVSIWLCDTTDNNAPHSSLLLNFPHSRAFYRMAAALRGAFVDEKGVRWDTNDADFEGFLHKKSKWVRGELLQLVTTEAIAAHAHLIYININSTCV